MGKIKTYPLVILISFSAFLAWMLIKQSGRDKKLFKAGFCGEVVQVEKSAKGNYHLRILENGKVKSVGYKPLTDGIFVNIHDSVCKQPGSQVYLIRKRETGNYVKKEWRSAFISGEWED